MSRYGKYFLHHLLCLEDAFCHYYVQGDSWERQEILDVEHVIFDWDEDAEAWLVQCTEHDPYTTLSRLRTLLAEDCLTQYQVHRMTDRQVVRTAARELSMNAYKMVIEPKIGWAVRVDPVTEEPVQPIAVEAAPDIDDMLDELRVGLDGLVDEQKKNYQQWEAKLADMSDAEKAALYGKKAGGGLYNATIGSLVSLVKAAPGLAKKAASAWWKFKTYPLRLAQITAQAIKTGSMDPLQKEIKAKLGPVVRGAKQLKHFTSMTMVLLGEEATRDMLLAFVDRYWDNTHPLEKTELGAEAASEVVINILLAIFTAGVGVAANVAAKSGRLIKVAKMLERVAGSLKRMKSLGRMPKKRIGGGKKGTKAKAIENSKGKGPEQPRTPEKKAVVDDDKKKVYSGKRENDGLKTTAGGTNRAVGGTRASVHRVVTDDEIKILKKEFEELGGDPTVLRFNEGSRTGYINGKINIRGDVFPNTFSTHPTSIMSTKSVLAHELGHFNHPDTRLRIGSWQDEFRASYSASKMPGLSDSQRAELIADGIAKAQDAGAKIKNNKYMLKILYGIE